MACPGVCHAAETARAMENSRASTEKLQQVAELFSTKSYQELRKDLESALHHKVVEGLCDFYVPLESQRRLGAIADLVSKQLEPLAAFNGKELKSREQVRAYLEALYTCADPKRWVSLWREALQFPELKERYLQVIAWLDEAFPSLSVRRRYALSDDSFRLLELGIMLAGTPVYGALADLARALKAQRDELQRIANQAGWKIGAKVAVKLVGRALFGPLGSLAAGALFNLAADDRAKMQATFNAVGEKWDNFVRTLSDVGGALEERYRYALTGLYGGLLSRFAEDLKALGLELEAVDWQRGRVAVVVTEPRRSQAVAWMSDTVRELEELLRKGDLERADRTSQLMVHTLLGQPHVGRVPYRERCLAYWAVAYRTVVLFQQAERLWVQGRQRDAAEFYRRWFEQAPLGVLEEPFLMGYGTVGVIGAGCRLVHVAQQGPEPHLVQAVWMFVRRHMAELGSPAAFPGCEVPVGLLWLVRAYAPLTDMGDPTVNLGVVTHGRWVKDLFLFYLISNGWVWGDRFFRRLFWRAWGWILSTLALAIAGGTVLLLRWI